MEFWFRRKFNLAPTDTRFLDATIEQIETEYWAHHFAESEGSGEEYDDEDFDLEAELKKMQGNPDEWGDPI